MRGGEYTDATRKKDDAGMKAYTRGIAFTLVRGIARRSARVGRTK